ncbi:hypothetical protein AB0A77_25720 [Streptomyces varsoviensis]|uniref:hypothetical protein n=1 Tax=Streptomyces varsoviensis TaxID=67373 RepID=UPI0033C84EE1
MRRGGGGGLRRWWPGHARDESASAEIRAGGEREAEADAETEAEITAFGEALNAHPFSPGQPGATDAMRAELARALDAYEQARRNAGGGRSRAGALDVLRALDDGRYALACLDALLADEPLPERMPSCFFDDRHGRAVRLVRWAPPGGTARDIAVCAADAVRLAEPPLTSPSPSPGPGLGARPASGPGRIAPRPAPESGNKPLLSGVRAPAAKLPEAAPLSAPQPQVSGEGSSGAVTHRLAMPTYRPALMVFSTHERALVNLRFEDGAGRSSRLYRLTGGGAPVVARVPLPAGAGKAVAFRVFAAGGRGSWTAGPAPLREAPRFHGEINGAGSDVVHYRGEPGRGVLRYEGPSVIQLEALDDRLAYRVTVAEGSGAGEYPFQWPGRGFYQVRSAGAWSLSTA